MYEKKMAKYLKQPAYTFQPSLDKIKKDSYKKYETSLDVMKNFRQKKSLPEVGKPINFEKETTARIYMYIIRNKYS